MAPVLSERLPVVREPGFVAPGATVVPDTAATLPVVPVPLRVPPPLRDTLDVIDPLTWSVPTETVVLPP